MIRVPVSLVAIAVGMGVCSALRDAGRFACIKWPNDVWFEGGKCGGILCESVKDADGRSVLIAGVGLNRDGAAERTTNGWPISGLGDVLACSDHAAPNPMLGPLVTGILGILTRDRADVAAAGPSTTPLPEERSVSRTTVGRGKDLIWALTVSAVCS